MGASKGKLDWISIPIAAVILLAGLARSTSLCAAEPAKNGKVERQGPLAGLPSAPGPHMEKIKALGDNEWLNLGSPAPDPKWGKGRGRSWSGKLAYASDLCGAFLAGQGVHGFIKPDGRYDDIFFYDLNAHRWICIYPGLNTKTFLEDIKRGDLKVNEAGQLADKEGQPILYAYGGHCYQSHAYDSERGVYMTSWPRLGLGGDQYSLQMNWDKEGKALLKEQLKGKNDRGSGAPFLFNTHTGKFERQMVDGPHTGTGGVLCYLDLRKTLWLYSGTTATWDHSGRRWVNCGAKGPTPKGIDFGACYDSKRDRVYVAGGSYRDPWGKDEGYVYTYDLKSNTWSNAPNKGNAPGIFAANVACMHYDAAADRVIDFVHVGTKPGVYAYDPETGAWDESALPLPSGMPFGEGPCWHGFYSAEVNAHFTYVAGDSDERGTMWAYRYKKAAAGK